MTCINPNCPLGFEKLIAATDGRDRWTPCCRNIRWWNRDGTLGGPAYETLFCACCRSSVCETKVGPYLRNGKRLPEVCHHWCAKIPDRWMPETSQLAYAIAAEFATFALYYATEEAARLNHPRALPGDLVGRALKWACMKIMNAAKRATPETILRTLNRELLKFIKTLQEEDE